ncbi:MAG: hypothetical protein Q9219_001195 [cf. Caloplaca sp. 3 TL-2023]
MFTLSMLEIVSYIVILILLYTITLVVYRLFLSPLSNVPGPILAAATGWYEFYFDCILTAQMTFEIDRLHRLYGPCVRISPWEVHIQDPDFVERLLSTTAHLDKDDSLYYRFVGAPKSSLATGPAALHKTRRAPLSPLFSKASVVRRVGLIHQRVRELLFRLEEEAAAAAAEQHVVDLSFAVRCVTFDIVTDFCLPRSDDKLAQDGFAPDFNQIPRVVARLSLWQRQLGFVIPLLQAFTCLPRRVIRTFAKQKYLDLLKVNDNLISQATEVAESGGSSPTPQSHPTMFHALLRSDLPLKEKSVHRMVQEAMTIIGAGVEALANPLTITMYELLKNPRHIENLREELRAVDTDPQSFLHYDQVKALPYLSAVINEGLRLGKESGRLPRINPRSPTTYQNFVFPPGTVLSGSLKDLHLNDEVFEAAKEFRPERWMDPASTSSKELQRHFMPFSRGARVCLGKHLAMVETYVCVANLVHRFEFEIRNTTQRDVDGCHDFFVPDLATDSHGLRVAAFLIVP